MLFKNTPDSYGAVSKAFHWLVAVIMICVLCMGAWLGNFASLPQKLHWFPYHKEFGICVLALAALRLGWRLYSPAPGYVPSLKDWEKKAARVMHAYLYLAMFAMPLSGWILSSAAGRTVNFFGLFDLPDLVGKSHDMKEFMEDIHSVVGYSLFFVLGVHAAAALKHHFIDHDATLRRMLPFCKTTGEKK